jgi:hypothetical protein
MSDADTEGEGGMFAGQPEQVVELSLILLAADDDGKNFFGAGQGGIEIQAAEERSHIGEKFVGIAAELGSALNQQFDDARIGLHAGDGLEGVGRDGVGGTGFAEDGDVLALQEIVAGGVENDPAPAAGLGILSGGAEGEDKSPFVLSGRGEGQQREGCGEEERKEFGVHS